jgi:ADP-heptose:LPS heptosyltransferase
LAVTDTRPTLVVLRALGLGDLLTGLPAMRALARAYPGHRRILAAPAWQHPIATMDDTVHEIVDVDGLAALPVALIDADVAVNLHGRGPQSTAILQALRPGRLISFGMPGGPRWRTDEHERQRWCRLLTDAGLHADPDDLHIRVPCGVPVSEHARHATVIHPGAASASRRWPKNRWSRVVTAERAAGRDVVITGGCHELPLARAVAGAAGLPASRVLAGRTNVLELLAVVSAADRAVCGDTGVAHVASAVGTPSVVLFGPTSPAMWGPPATGPHIALWHGDRGDPHAERLDQGLAAIGVDDVLAALARLPTDAGIER